jgi:hypothetical protein
MRETDFDAMRGAEEEGGRRDFDPLISPPVSPLPVSILTFK